MVLVTVGHGTLSASDFVSLVRGAGVGLVVDVRRYPASRRHPHFRAHPLAAALAEAGIGYRHEPDLGGRRAGRTDSPHLALRNEQFRGYADHMETPAFRAALRRVLADARERRVAVLCAESVWWRCHRRLVADAAVLLHGEEVEHLFHDARTEPHHPADEARVEGTGEAARVVYDRGADQP